MILKGISKSMRFKVSYVCLQVLIACTVDGKTIQLFGNGNFQNKMATSSSFLKPL
jgi:hypothetical protein